MRAAVATDMIADAIVGMGIFFHEIECSIESARVTVTLFSYQDALEVAYQFSQAGVPAHADGTKVIAWALEA